MLTTKSLPSLSVVMACGAALSHVRDAIACLRRSPLDARHVVYTGLESLVGALSALIPGEILAALPRIPTQMDKIEADCAVLAKADLPEGANVLGTPILVPVMTATGTNDITIADDKLVAHLGQHKRLTKAQLRDWGADNEQFARLIGAGRIVVTGKGRSAGFMLPIPAEVIDSVKTDDVIPFDEPATVAEMPFAATGKPVQPSGGAEGTVTPPAPANAPGAKVKKPRTKKAIAEAARELVTPPTLVPVTKEEALAAIPKSVDPVKEVHRSGDDTLAGCTTDNLLNELLSRIEGSKSARAKGMIRELKSLRIAGAF